MIRRILITAFAGLAALAQVAPGVGGPVGLGGGSPSSIMYTPTGGNTSSSLQDYLDLSRFRPEGYRAAADGTTDDSVAIQSAATAAAAAGETLYFRPGKTYYCTAKITILCNVGPGSERATLKFGAGAGKTDYNDYAVQLGDGTNYLTGKTIYLPYVTTARTDATKWDAVASSVGVYAVNVENTTVFFGGISNMGVGLWLDANATGGNHGFCYNRFFLNAMIDNKIGVKEECTAAGGWVNENTIFGGRFQMSSSYGTNPMWTRHVYVKTWATAGSVSTGAQSMTVDSSAKTITMTSTTGLYAGAWVTFSGFANAGNNKVFQVDSLTATVLTLRSTTTGLVNETATATGVTDGAPFGNVPNSNHYIGCSFEGAVEAFIEIRGGLQHDFTSCRFEPVSGQGNIYFSGLASAAPAKYNRIWGGYSNGGGDFVVKDGSNSYANGGLYSERMATSASGSYGLVQYSNSGSDTYPFLTIWPSAATESVLFKPTGTNWHMQLGGYYIDGKAAADANPRFRLAGQTGRLYLGAGGANALASYFDVYGTNAGAEMVSGDLAVGTVGYGLRVKEGTNAKMGTAVLVAGSKVVSTTAVTANSRIFLTSNADGGTPGWLRVSARSAGTSFTITSSSGTDTSTVAWIIIEPS